MNITIDREYHTMDKSDWGDGPWQNEPDKIEWRDDATGLPCLILRNSGGALCGYVGVSSGHPVYRHDYDDVNVLVHGGLTYANHCQAGDEAETVCHVPRPGEDDHVWWLGFDCAHYMDRQPAWEAVERSLSIAPIASRAVYRDVEYVVGQVTSLAAQLGDV